MDASSPSAAVQLTNDGGEQKMLNGVCDWANEEENIKSDNTIYWSPDGSTILFASYDLTNVELLEYNTYGGPYKKVEKMNDRYPITRQIKYAKVTSKMTTLLYPHLFNLFQKDMSLIWKIVFMNHDLGWYRLCNSYNVHLRYKYRFC